MKKFVILFVLMSAFFVHSQVETLTGHSFFRDQMQQPGFQQNGPIICDVGFEKDTIKKTIGKKLKPPCGSFAVLQIGAETPLLAVQNAPGGDTSQHPHVAHMLCSRLVLKHHCWLYRTHRGTLRNTKSLNH